MPKPKKQLSKKTAAIGAVGAIVGAAIIALVANAGRVCATAQNSTVRAVCETVVETAKQSKGGAEQPADAGVEL